MSSLKFVRRVAKWDDLLAGFLSQSSWTLQYLEPSDKSTGFLRKEDKILKTDGHNINLKHSYIDQPFSCNSELEIYFPEPAAPPASQLSSRDIMMQQNEIRSDLDIIRI